MPQIQIQFGDELITLHVEAQGDGWQVRLPDGAERGLTAQRLLDDILQITETDTVTPHTFRVATARTPRGIEFAYDGETYLFTPPAVRLKSGKAGRTSGSLAAPMVGVVVAVLAQAGQKVEAYEPLVVVEAMKVMATVEAPFAGTIRRILVEKGQNVTQGALVVELEAG